MYMHESKFLTKSLFPFLLRMLHAPTYAPSCTQRALPPPTAAARKAAQPQGRLNEADWALFLSSFLWKASQLRPGKDRHHTPAALWKSKGGARHGVSWPFQAVTLIPLIGAWVSLQNTGTDYPTKLGQNTHGQYLGQMGPATPKGCGFLKTIHAWIQEIREIDYMSIISSSQSWYHQLSLQIKAMTITITRQQGQCSDDSSRKTSSFSTSGN